MTTFQRTECDCHNSLHRVVTNLDRNVTVRSFINSEHLGGQWDSWPWSSKTGMLQQNETTNETFLLSQGQTRKQSHKTRQCLNDVVHFLQPSAICGWFEQHNVNLGILTLCACKYQHLHKMWWGRGRYLGKKNIFSHVWLYCKCVKIFIKFVT